MQLIFNDTVHEAIIINQSFMHAQIPAVTYWEHATYLIIIIIAVIKQITCTVIRYSCYKIVMHIKVKLTCWYCTSVIQHPTHCNQQDVFFMPKYGCSDSWFWFSSFAFLLWEQMKQQRSQNPLDTAQPICRWKEYIHTCASARKIMDALIWCIYTAVFQYNASFCVTLLTLIPKSWYPSDVGSLFSWVSTRMLSATVIEELLVLEAVSIWMEPCHAASNITAVTIHHTLRRRKVTPSTICIQRIHCQ